MWHNNKKVLRTYSTNDAENSWAYIEGVGQRKIQTGAADGVTNLFILLSAARASDRMVNVLVNDDSKIARAYL